MAGNRQWVVEFFMIVSYTLTTLWHERQRYFSGVLAVAFSAILITLQTGLLWGLFATTSAPIDHAGADIWLGRAPRPQRRSWAGHLGKPPQPAGRSAWRRTT